MSMQDSGVPSPALLLVGHGTRDVDGQREFDELAQKVVRAVPRTLVVSCCLELARPTIAEGVERLAKQGVKHFVVVPVLLFAGGHARKDIPTAVAEATVAYPGMTFVQSEHLGCQIPMLHASVRKFLTAARLGTAGQGAAKSSSSPSDLPFVVMIGRGGSDLDALDEMRHFVEFRMRLTPAAGVTIGFMAGNERTLAEALDVAERSGIRRIVVQPHLLFQGRLVKEVGRQTLERAVRRPDLEWFLADHLGPADEVISILVENYAG